MDSDSELHATDTLRFDSESEDDATPSGKQSVIIHTGAQQKLSPGISASITNDLECSELPQSKKSDGSNQRDLHSKPAGTDKEDEEETIRTSNRNAKKTSKIIDSDSDEEDTMLRNEPDVDTTRSEKSTPNVVDRLKSLLDSESDSDADSFARDLNNSNTEDEFKNKENSRKTRNVLSDSEGEDISKNSTSGNTRSKPARKKRVEKHKVIAKINTAQDILASVSNQVKMH